MGVASPYAASDWLLDSEATPHITSDLNNLALHKPYNGGDDVLIIDSFVFSISHTGSAFLPLNSRALAFNKVSYVPDIHKNLISVYRLYNANRVSMEFFVASFHVKDLSTGAPLLQGRTKDKLYQWPVTHQALAVTKTSSSKTSLSSWHSRLDFPLLSILNTGISHNSLPFSNSLQNPISCSDCIINKSHKLPFATSSIQTNAPLECVFSNLWSSPIVSFDNYKYYLVLVDTTQDIRGRTLSN